ncbi:MAG: ABC transporter ATP-binding protein [Pseudomonadota bacterium]
MAEASLSDTGTDERAPVKTDAGEESLSGGLRSLLPFARTARGPLALAGAIAAVAALAGLVPYWAVYNTAVELLAKTPDQSRLWMFAGAALVGTVLRFVCFGAANFVAHKAAFEIQYRIRLRLAEHLAVVPLGYVNERRSGELKKVMADDVERLELFLAHAVPDLVATTLTLTALLGWMLFVDWRMALAVFVPVVPALAMISVAMRRGSVYNAEYKQSQGLMNASIVELIRGMPVVKMFNRATDEVRSTERLIDRYVAVVRDYSLMFLPYGTAFYVLLASNVLFIVPVGGWLWISGGIDTASLLFFLIVGLGALSTLVALFFLFANLSHIASGGTLVREILDQPPLAAGTTAAESPRDSRLTFDNVSFRYEERWVLENLSFEATPGTLTAIVGPSGGGKSTIASLVGRFWDPQQGSVRLGGVDLRALSADELAAQVTFVLQETFLFNDTIAANLRLAKPDASDDELHEAMDKAQLTEFLAALPAGLQTAVGEGGTRLSGGERQRLTIARAILADAPLVVLDEATAFVDPENEVALQQAIGELIGGKTVLMIAHRLSTVAGADQILVVDQGRLVEQGTHQNLLDAGGLYATLWQDFVAANALGLSTVNDRRPRSHEARDHEVQS